MLEGFICPDKEVTTLQGCFKSCRMGDRCLTLPTLHYIGKEREWTGTPSTTQLLNGTMMEFLKLTQPYVKDPDGSAFALLGTLHHNKLEEVAKELGIPSEIPLTGDDRDIFDLLEFDPEAGWCITDYKTWGSYKVQKALGLVETGKRPDPSGAVYKSSGKWGKAGSPKMVSTWSRMNNAIDNEEAELQQNRYRIMLLDKFNITVSRMKLQVTVRDGGLAVANSRGLNRNMYMINIPHLDDDMVREYFQKKTTDLLNALQLGECHTLCTEKENWSGTRCKSYCDVCMHCPKGQLEHR